MINRDPIIISWLSYYHPIFPSLSHHYPLVIPPYFPNIFSPRGLRPATWRFHHLAGPGSDLLDPREVAALRAPPLVRRGNLGKTWGNLGKPRENLGKTWGKPEETWGNLGKTWGNLGNWKIWGRITGKIGRNRRNRRETLVIHEKYREAPYDRQVCTITWLTVRFTKL